MSDVNTHIPSDCTVVNEIKQYILNSFMPCNYVDALQRLSHDELHKKLIACFPTDKLSKEYLFTFMKENDFEYYEVKPFYFEWALGKK